LLAVYVSEPLVAPQGEYDTESVPESDVPEANVPVTENDGVPPTENEKEPLATLTGVPNVVVVVPVVVQPPVVLKPKNIFVIPLPETVKLIVLSWDVLPVHVPS
jgi:hypothetical protein